MNIHDTYTERGSLVYRRDDALERACGQVPSGGFVVGTGHQHTYFGNG